MKLHEVPVVTVITNIHGEKLDAALEGGRVAAQLEDAKQSGSSEYLKGAVEAQEIYQKAVEVAKQSE